MTEERNRITVRLRDLLGTLLRMLPVIICWSAFCFVLLFYMKDSRKDPSFTAETSIYVWSRTADSDYGRLDISDLDVSRQMTIDAMSFLGSEQVADKVIANLRGDAHYLRGMTARELLDMVEIYKQDDSLEVTIAVYGPDPYVVCDIANTYRETAIRELDERLMAKGIQTAKEAMIPLSPSGRSALFYGLIGLVFGLVSSVGLITSVYIFRYAERSREDVEEI